MYVIEYYVTPMKPEDFPADKWWKLDAHPKLKDARIAYERIKGNPQNNIYKYRVRNQRSGKVWAEFSGPEEHAPKE